MILKRDSRGRFVRVSGPKKVSIEERRKHDSERAETLLLSLARRDGDRDT